MAVAPLIPKNYCRNCPAPKTFNIRTSFLKPPFGVNIKRSLWKGMEYKVLLVR